MKRTLFAMVSLLSLLAVIAAAARAQTSAPAAQPAARPAAPAMTLAISGFSDGSEIPLKFTQSAPGAEPGGGTSPAIHWGNVPPGTQSFVLNMRDLDVARNKTTEDQAHWVVWPIPANVTSLSEGQPKGAKLPNGAYQVSATGLVYRGPGAPATGPKHHYMFEIYALDTTINVEPVADAFETRTNVFKAMQGHVLGKAVYGGLFHKPQ
ncbi:MAG: YbhB/YbcL family Raf kinase inhibitor-like protein [Myxococcales bacterium]